MDRFVKRAKGKFKLIIIYFQSLMYRSDCQTVGVVTREDRLWWGHVSWGSFRVI